MFVPNTSNSSARPPTEIGVNATVIVQVAFAARVEAQVVEATEKSPFTPQPRDCSASGPSFLIVITCPALVVPTGWLPKARLGWRVDSCASEVVEVKVPLTPPMVSVVVTAAPGVPPELCRTHTDWPGLIVPARFVNVPVQPMEYSPPATEIGAGS